MEQRSKEWYQAREGRITGSAVGAILGMSPFQSRDDVLRRMVREYHQQDAEFTGNVATEYGTLNETNALQDYEMESGNTVEKVGFILHSDWLGASPDGLVDNDGLIEIKCPYSMRHETDPQFKSISEQMHYFAQIQIQLYCTGRKWCDFYQWCPYGSSVERVNIDPAWLEEALEELKLFYECYKVAREPENAWRYTDGGELEKKYKKAMAMLEVVKSEVEEAKQALIDATDGQGGKIGTLNITKVKRKGSVSYAKAVKDLLPDADLSAYEGKETEYWKIS